MEYQLPVAKVWNSLVNVLDHSFSTACAALVLHSFEAHQASLYYSLTPILGVRPWSLRLFLAEILEGDTK